METVNSMAAAAAKAVWGESDTTTTTANNETHGQEPISGVQGDVSKGEPFDKGNIDPQPNASSVNSHEPSTTGTPTTSTAHSTHQASTTTPTTSSTTTEPHHDSAQFAKTTGTAAGGDKVPDNKHTEMKAQDTPADTSKAQNDTRDPENPQTHPKNAATDVDNTGDGINKGQDLDKIPPPKPLDELARERGGDAGKVDVDSSKADSGIVGDKKDEAGSAGDSNGPPRQELRRGHGRETSGLQADGGDFDATKPGAGREADRLLEQKGIHVSKGVPPKPEDEGAADKEHADKGHADKDSGSSEKSEKKGTLSKIKEKLHRH
ncbi:uncharacterized protein PG986_001518 [Apiospora aurea]|uniref:Glycine-rich cell wall structural protein 1 n=1 Tax=Apiospora aurea TaxID=335848 RepID=A0ABR1QX08_9PEZI